MDSSKKSSSFNIGTLKNSQFSDGLNVSPNSNAVLMLKLLLIPLFTVAAKFSFTYGS